MQDGKKWNLFLPKWSLLLGTRQIRDELESAYASRCDPDTIKGCAKTNFHDCASKFPDPTCGLVNDNKDPSQSVCQCGCE